MTYIWYRSIDQPSLADADLSAGDRTRLQAIVEKIHVEWTSEKNYTAPPTHAKLAALDPALFVRPPKGMEVGFVPIVTSQTPGR